jgi:hypothetical protein
MPIIDLIAGLIFIYFLLSIVNNSMFEIFSSVFKLRAYLLKKWLVETFKNKSDNTMCANAIMNHPLVSGLSKQDQSPSYMEGKAFAKVIADIIIAKLIVPGNTTPTVNVDALFQTIDSFGMPPKIPETLKTFIIKTKLEKQLNNTLNEIDHFEKQIEAWFDSAMERVGSRFKRRTFLFTFIFSTILTCSLNVDSIALAKYLYSSDEAREKWAAEAYRSAGDPSVIKYVDDLKAKNASTSKDTAVYRDLDSLSQKIRRERVKIDSIVNKLNTTLPIGWTDEECVYWSQNKFRKIGGWILTILAVCLGAPFWFELLTKVANIRSTIKPSKSEDEGKPGKTKR